MTTRIGIAHQTVLSGDAIGADITGWLIPNMSVNRVRSTIGDLRIRVAEGVGFEPTVSCPTHAFQACRFGRSRTPPGTVDVTSSPLGRLIALRVRWWLARAGRVRRDGSP